MATTPPAEVATAMGRLLTDYNRLETVSFKDIVNFHYQFESIHPFQDGNGRVGRIIMFKECLKNNIVPFIIGIEHQVYYYRGLKEYRSEPGFLTDTCLSSQDQYRAMIAYFYPGI